MSSITTTSTSNVLPCASHHMHQIKEEEEEEKERAACGGSQTRWRWGEEWKRAYLVTCAAGLIVDPLFLYTLSISSTMMCLFIDGWFALTVTLIKSMIDVLHVCNIWLKLSSSFSIFFSSSKPDNSSSGRYSPRCRPVVHSNSNTAQSLAVNQDKEVEEDSILLENKLHKRRGCIYFLKSNKSLILDLYVILPLIQVVLWVAAPHLIRKGSTTTVMTVFLVVFLLQYLPKIYHSVRFLRSMHNFSGYIFGTIWWGIALNLIAYFVASHAVGACWYLLGIQRASKCLKEQCTLLQSGSSLATCTTTTTACLQPIYYGASMRITEPSRISWAQNQSARDTCLATSDKFQYGAYKWTVQLVTNNNRLEKILLPIFWGLMTLSTFGNLESTTEWLEIVFNIIIITGGLILVTMLIGNIKVFLNATTSKKQSMHLRMRNMDWWMKKKKVPRSFRQRVKQYERQRWAAMRGVDEVEMVRNLPEGLRRDIKYHLCLDLVRQVPLFQHMDELVLENICDRVKSLIFPKGEVITREGDPVQRMVFVVRGHLQSSQQLRNGVKSYCMLGPGNFSGDELLSWCMRRPFIERLPPSSSSLVTLETTEAFGLEASDVKYVTQHFRYTFVNEKVRRSARYYSPGWRTWAAVAIQLAWRRYTHRKTLSSLSFIRPRRPISRCSSMGEEKLRLYTALLTSPKPHADDFFM